MLSCIRFVGVEKSYEFSLDALGCCSRDLYMELAQPKNTAHVTYLLRDNPTC
jgi:hypothetical protein